jgi:hypothetical protein
MQPNDRPWLSFPGLTTDLKILHVDEERNIVVVMSRIAAGGDGGKHLHLCEAIAYTARGEWAYDNGSLPEGAVAIEPHGSIHTPTSEGGSEQFVVFVGTGPDLLQTLDEDDNVVATTSIKHFKLLHDMTPEEAMRTGLVSMASRDNVRRD